jgi:hypothetical protein
MRRTTTIAGLVLLTTAVVGWGDDDDGRTEAEEDADEEQAEEIVLTLDDLPDGWVANPSDDDDDVDDDDDQVQAELADCLGVDESVLDPDNPEAESPEFTSPTDQEVNAKVAFTPSADDATEALDRIKDDAAPDCLAQAMTTLLADNLASQEGVPADLDIGEVTVEPLAFPDLGDDSLAHRVTVPVTTQGVTIELYIDQVLTRVGRVGITGQFQSQVTPFDTAEAARLMEVMVDRVPADA